MNSSKRTSANATFTSSTAAEGCRSLPNSPAASRQASGPPSLSSFQSPSGASTPKSSASAAGKDYQQSTNDAEPNWPAEWKAYACLFGCFLLMFNSWGLVNAYGTYLSYYQDHLIPQIDTLLLNLIGSTQSFVVLLPSFAVGRILDAGFARPLLGVGTVLIILGMFLISVVSGDGGRGDGDYGKLWAVQGFVVGLGMACFFVSSSQIAATWFVKRKAVAVGIVASGASIAGLVYPLATKFLITSVGFNNAVRYVSTITGVTAILSFLLAVPNPKHPFRKPEKWMKIGTFFDVEAFRNPSFNWFTAAICFVFFGFYAVFFNLEEWAASHGFGYKGETPPAFSIESGDTYADRSIRTFWLLSIMNAASTLGRVLSATFSERFGTLNIHTVCTSVGSLLIFALWIPTKTLEPAIAFCVVWGAISGAIIGLPPASIANILGRSDPSRQARLGQWTGTMYSVSATFALTGPVIAGYLVSAFDDYLTCQAWAGACLTMASLCMGISRMYLKQGRSLQAMRSLKGSVASTMSFTTGRKGSRESDEEEQKEEA